MLSDMVRAWHGVLLSSGFTSFRRKEEIEGRVKEVQNLLLLRMPMAKAEHRKLRNDKKLPQNAPY